MPNIAPALPKSYRAKTERGLAEANVSVIFDAETKQECSIRNTITRATGNKILNTNFFVSVLYLSLLPFSSEAYVLAVALVLFLLLLLALFLLLLLSFLG